MNRGVVGYRYDETQGSNSYEGGTPPTDGHEVNEDKNIPSRCCDTPVGPRVLVTKELR